MSTLSVTLFGHSPLEIGTRVQLVGAGGEPSGAILIAKERLPRLRMGDALGDAVQVLFRVLRIDWRPGVGIGPATRCVLVEACAAVEAGAELALTVRREGVALAWVTLSDKGSRGEREDGAGPLAAQLIAEALPLGHSAGFLLPDEELELRALLTDLALVQGADLIVTSGGTGVGPRDITPEATLAVIEKRLPGMERAMTAFSLLKTPHAVISRAVAGTL
ncbi:MAG: MogA/MoaB family molybdenum cofactor biosynthesis protein, partial [Proteobacteria bacterium]|nr:MogA/MoaB family molybdenum cofactor biosynthesis protein [Pseudomonadota bacterium]MBU1612340.1 MogA/MoaB family molybdenum cofactor biosynthesis protein [Pseudomonadota bacterium]